MVCPNHRTPKNYQITISVGQEVLKLRESGGIFNIYNETKGKINNSDQTMSHPQTGMSLKANWSILILLDVNPLKSYTYTYRK